MITSLFGTLYAAGQSLNGQSSLWTSINGADWTSLPRQNGIPAAIHGTLTSIVIGDDLTVSACGEHGALVYFGP